MSRRSFPSSLLVAAIAACVCASGAHASDVPAARAARNCNAPKYPGSGYFTSLKVVNVTCKTGSALALAHYRCRIKKGAAGTCGHARGYSCSERRTRIPTEINALVTCRNGAAKVVFSYQQNT